MERAEVLDLHVLLFHDAISDDFKDVIEDRLHDLLLDTSIVHNFFDYVFLCHNEVPFLFFEIFQDWYGTRTRDISIGILPQILSALAN